MKHRKSHMWLLAVTGVAIWCGGCDLGAQREESARLRLERKMAEARLTAAHELLAAGYVEQAQRVLQPYLPVLEEQTAADEVQVAQGAAADASDRQQFVRAESQESDQQSDVY